MASEILSLEIRANGSRVAKRDLESIGKSAKGTLLTLSRLQAALGLLGGGLAIRQLANYSNAYVELQNRIRVVTNTTGELNVITEELFKISQRTRSSVEGNAALFQRLSLATKALGTSQSEVLDFTEKLNKAIIVSGATAREAEAGLIQFSQGIASGTLRGDELRSVLEQLPAVADILGKELGVTRGELRELGFQGKITTDVILSAFRNAGDELEENFAKTVATLPQAFTILRNEIIQTFGTLGESTGITNLVTKAVLALADNFETLARAAISAGTAISIIFAKQALGAAITGLRLFSVALLTNPLGVFVVALGAAASFLVGFGDKITVAKDSIVTFADLGIALFFNVRDAISSFVDTASAAFDKLGFSISDTIASIDFKDVVLFVASAIDGVISLFQALRQSIEEDWQLLPAVIINTLVDALNTLAQKFRAGLNKLGAIINDFTGRDIFTPKEFTNLITPFEDAGKIAGDNFNNNLEAALQRNTGARDTVLKSFEDASQRAVDRKVEQAKRDIENQRARDALGNVGENKVGQNSAVADKILKDLRDEQSLLLLTNRERQIRSKLIDIENKLVAKSAPAGVIASTLTSAEALLRENAAMEQKIAIVDELGGAQVALSERMVAFQDLQGTAISQTGAFKIALQDLAIQQAELNIANGEGTFLDGYIVSLTAALDQTRTFAAEAGELMGNFVNNAVAGFADVAAEALIMGGSFKDAFGDFARKAIQDLLKGLIQLGIQFVLNAAIQKAVGSTVAAASAAEAGAVAAAWAPAAALSSAATLGANSAPASAGLLGVLATALGIGATAKRQLGGDLLGGQLARVGEGSRPEMFMANGKQFMIPPERGRVTPLNETNANQGQGQQAAPAQVQGSITVRVADNPEQAAEVMVSSIGTPAVENELLAFVERNASTINSRLQQ